MHNDFCGWYFKCQSDSRTLAVIPAIHRGKVGRAASLQLITDSDSWYIHFPYSAYHNGKFCISIANNQFGRHGICLNLHTQGLHVSGSVLFGELTRLPYDIMGPFRYVPFMECRHSILSMKHVITGEITINGKPYMFQNGIGYWEGDRGRSFPKKYAWTQYSFPGGSLMLSVADIPFGRFCFTGAIAVVLWEGRQYRLATYLGAKVTKIHNGEIVIRQGNRSLRAKLLEQSAHPLCAPQIGQMSRTIHEHASCRAFYQFKEKGETLFALEAKNASFEYEYPE